ncbi:Uncharacterised protein [Mycobacterium tuberculosis]|nr:Uncharacterised protein [Mycobacterium tuberculosis]
MWSISTLPSISLARQVPHAPPMHAYGASLRSPSAPSRIESPGTRSNIARCPDSVKVTVAPA